MDSWLAELRGALRQFRAAPLFACASVATLAVGIGATTAIFSTVNATLLRPLPFRNPGELMGVRTRLVDGRVTTGLVSPAEIAALNDAHSVVVRAAGFSARPLDGTFLPPDGVPTSVVLIGVTEGFFDVLQLPMVRGRAFTHEEHVPSGPNAPVAVVVSWRAWKNLFGGDPDVVGTTLRIAEVPGSVTVVGVAAADLDLPHGTDFWFNSRTSPQNVAHVFDTVLRLRRDATVEQLRSAAAAAMTELARTTPSAVGREYVIRPLVVTLVGDLGPMLLIVLAAAALLLGLACVNVTNLLLARGTARTREIAIRAALGASRGRIARQLMLEALVLATAGATTGLLLANGAVRLLLALGASKLPRLDEVPFDAPVLLFATAVLVLSSVAIGLAPAWRLAATDIRTILGESGRNATPGRVAARLMSMMIVTEIALAVALVAGAGWLVQAITRLRTLDPGFTAEGRLVVDVRPPRTFGGLEEAYAWSDELLRRIRTAAGDGALVGAASTFPFRVERDATFMVELQTEAPDPNRVRGGHFRRVTPGFFEAMDTQLIAGRTFTDDDRQGTQAVAVVNSAFVRRFFPDAVPLGEAFAYGYPTVDRGTMTRIVGIVRDVRYKSLADEAEATFYVPAAQTPYPIERHAVVVVSGRTPQALAPAIREELRQFNPQLVVTLTPATEILAETLNRQQLATMLMLIFGGTALVLAAIGIYGVVAYAAALRRGEFATRIALGASRRQVFWRVFATAQQLAGAGLLLGLAIAYLSGRIVAARIYEMRAADPYVLLSALLIVGSVTLLATTIPAIRASRVDPVSAIRPD